LNFLEKAERPGDGGEVRARMAQELQGLLCPPVDDNLNTNQKMDPIDRYNEVEPQITEKEFISFYPFEQPSGTNLS